MKLLLLITLCFSATCQALEADNYLVWDKDLKDSSDAIDEYINGTINRVLKSNPASCRKAIDSLGKEWSTYLVHDTPVENHLLQTLSEAAGEIYPQNRNFVKSSIYRHPFRFYIPAFGLAPNIQVNGYYFGTDKLSHFVSTGLIYFKQFEKYRKLGLTEEEAEQKAINWGLKDEKRVHGYWASGVFSYADLEANYQGLRFYRSLCEKGRIRKPHNRAWMMIEPFSIKAYINGNWDESYQESYRIQANWKKVAPVLRSYCSALDSSKVKQRFEYYRRSSKASFSMTYIQSLLKSQASKIPSVGQQSLSHICHR